MHSQWREFVKDYLTFSKKERNGIFITIFLCVLIYTIPRVLSTSKTNVDKDAFQKELAQLTMSIDTSQTAYSLNRDDETADYYRPKHNDNYNREKGELFVFDPNTLDAAGWKRLGVREKTIYTIQNFVAKGYKFRQAADLRKIYGLRKQEADLLIPYVRIAEKETIAKSTFEFHYSPNTKKREDNFSTRIIEINSADTSDFIALPGIGSKLASRIVNFREKLGGFNSVNQMSETYGIPDSTFQKIKVRLRCANESIRKININSAEANELKVHPYIRWNIANAIVNFRTQHGPYKTIEDLRKIEIIPDELFNKIAPYVVL